MEPEVREFLKRVGLSIGVGFLWLAITAIAALKGDNGFIEGPIRVANVLFYAWVVISIIIVIKLMKKIWDRDFEEERLKDSD